VTQSTKKNSAQKNKNTLPRASQDTRQRLLCRGPGQLALGKGDTGRRRLVDRDFAESAPLPSALLSTKSLFADRLISALGKEPFAESLTWRSAKKALCRVSTRQLSAKMPALGKVGFSCSERRW